MKNQFTLILVILLFATSCNETETRLKSNNSNEKIKPLLMEIQVSDIQTNKPANEISVKLINENCVCFVQLTTVESDSLEQLDPEKYSINSEYLNNESTRIYELLTDNKIKSVWTDKRYIKFKTIETEFYIDTRKKDLTLKCLIFDIETGLKIIDSESINETNINKIIRIN